MFRRVKSESVRGKQTGEENPSGDGKESNVDSSKKESKVNEDQIQQKI